MLLYQVRYLDAKDFVRSLCGLIETLCIGVLGMVKCKSAKRFHKSSMVDSIWMTKYFVHFDLFESWYLASIVDYESVIRYGRQNNMLLEE